MERPHGENKYAKIVSNRKFDYLIMGMIIVNALLIGVGTYPSMADNLGTLDLIDRIILFLFTIEVILRFAAADFSVRKWGSSYGNLFDFFIVAAAWIPGISSQSTILRILRLARVARMFKFLTDVTIMFDGLKRSFKPAAGLCVMTTLLVYVYAILGWSFFGESDPERWGTAGTASMTMFNLLTLEGWNEIFYTSAEKTGQFHAMAVFIISFILIGTFVVVNLLIGVVLTSLEEARKHHLSQDTSPRIADAVEDVHAALDALDAEFKKLYSNHSSSKQQEIKAGSAVAD